MAVTLNLLIGDDLHEKLEEFAILYNEKITDHLTKSQAAQLLILVALKHHSVNTLCELVHNVLHPPKKTKSQLARQGKKSAVQNKN